MAVTVIGDAFIDIIVPVHDIEPGGTYHRDILATCGGTATTAIQIAKLGEEASFLGRVGNDALGQYFKENLKKNQVKDMTVVDNDHDTGLCVAMVYANGERSMVAYRGANNCLAGQDIENRINAIFKSKIIYLSGYSLAKMDVGETLPILKRCRDKGCEVWFNPGAPNIIAASLKYTIQQFFDVLILNLDEAKALTGKRSIVEMKAELEQFARFTIITMGEEGCFLLKDGQSTVVGSKVVKNITDTTGAGDAFSAGFIVGRLRHLPDIECAQLAHHTAARFLEDKEGFNQ